MPFAPFKISRWVHGATLIAEPDQIADEALRRATNVRLDRTLGVIESRPGWSAKTLTPLLSTLTYLSRLFLPNGTIYNYAQVDTILQRLSSTWATPVTIATPGAHIVSDANSPDGHGHLFKYFVNDAIAFKDDGTGTFSAVMGIPPPTAAPLSSTLAPDLFTTIDHMDAAANWTGSNLSAGPTDSTTIWALAVNAVAAIGAGADGTVNVFISGAAGNAWTITVTTPAGTDLPLTTSFLATAVTVALGTDSAGALDPTKNTAGLVADGINGLGVMGATASGTGASSLTMAEGPTALAGGSGGNSVTFTIVASTFGSIGQFLGAAVNLDTLTDGDADVKDDDYIHLRIRADHPERITFLQLDIDIDSNSTVIGDCFRHDYYSIRLGSLTTLSQGRDQWTKVQIRKASFARYGTDTTRSWANARGFRVGFQTNTLGTVILFVDDWKLRGGVGMEGDIEHTVCYKHSNTGARGNPAKDADGIVLYTQKITTDRQRIDVNLSNVLEGGAAHPTDTQIDEIMVWRRGGTFTTAALVDTILDASINPMYRDHTSDFTLVLTNTFLETDNDPPPTGTSRVLFGPDGTGHFFMIVNGFRLYFSKPYEDKENRVENWPPLAFGLVGDGSTRVLAGAASGKQIRVWTGTQTYDVVGIGSETFLPVPIEGTRGIVGQHAVTTGAGVFFFVSQDGIWADAAGKQTKLTSAIDPFFQGRTVDGQVGLGVPPATTRLAFLPDPQGSLLVMTYPGGFLVLKPNLQDGKLTECFFGESALTQLTALYLDSVNRELLAGGADGHVYRIEDPAYYTDVSTPVSILVRSKSYDLGQPQHGKLLASAEVEGMTNTQGLTLKAYYDRNATAENLGFVHTTSETAVFRSVFADPTVARRDVSLELSGLVSSRIAITRLGCMYEAQPEALTFLDSGLISFDFKQQLKRFEVDIQVMELATVMVYAEGVVVFTGAFVPTITRTNTPYFLPAGLRGRVWRVTLLSSGAAFLCYKWSGFFKQLGTNQAYQEKVLINGV